MICLICITACGKTSIPAEKNADNNDSTQISYSENNNVSDDKYEPLSIGEFFKTRESIWLLTGQQIPLDKDKWVTEILYFKDGKVDVFNLREDEYYLGELSQKTKEELIDIGRAGNQHYIDARRKNIENALNREDYNDPSYDEIKNLYKEYDELLKNYNVNEEHFGDFKIEIITDGTGNNTDCERLHILYTNRIPYEKINDLFYNIGASSDFDSGATLNYWSGGGYDDNTYYYKSTSVHARSSTLSVYEPIPIDLNDYQIVENSDKYVYITHTFSDVHTGDVIYNSEYVQIYSKKKHMTLCTTPSVDLVLDAPTSKWVDMVDSSDLEYINTNNRGDD